MTKTVNQYDAKRPLPQSADSATGGEEIIIAKAGMRPLRKPGGWEGMVWIAIGVLEWADFSARNKKISASY